MDVIEGMRREYSMAKRFWLVLIMAQTLVTLGALYVVYYPTKQRLIGIGVVGFVVTLLTFYFRESAGTHYGLAERLRRLLVIQDGLGRQPSAQELVDIAADCTALPTLAPKPLGNYYNSPLPAGPSRLAHIIEESAAYTRKVASLASAFFGGLTLLGIILTFLIVWLGLESLSFASEGHLDGEWWSAGRLAKLLAISLPFFLTGTFATLWRAFASLSNSARKAYQRCDQLRQLPDVGVVDVMVTMGSYDCALAKSPPLPGLMYWMARSRIAKAWEVHMK